MVKPGEQIEDFIYRLELLLKWQLFRQLNGTTNAIINIGLRSAIWEAKDAIRQDRRLLWKDE
jgi:hypothetical protein